MEIGKLNQKEVLRYLGGNNTYPDERLLSILEKCENILQDCINSRYTYKIFVIVNSEEESAISLKGCTLKLEGQNIAARLSNCSKVILLASTLSAEVDKTIRLSQINDVSEAVILDAMANVAIDQVCDIAEEEIKEALESISMPIFFTRRFSPGYGDLPISIQKEFLDVLDAPKKIGLCATENSLLTPKKSVTAIIGISNIPIENDKTSCQSCNLYNTCIYRKRGEHCDNK